jgi:hypothetical protein
MMHTVNLCCDSKAEKISNYRARWNENILAFPVDLLKNPPRWKELERGINAGF